MDNIEQLIQENKGLIVNVIKKYLPGVIHSYELDDYIQEGNIAIYNAARYFDKSKGNEFSTLAFTFIKNRLIVYSKRAENKLKQSPTNINIVSIHKEIGPGITILDAIKDKKTNIENSYVENDERKRMIEKLNKILPKKSKIAFHYMLQRKSRKEISEILGCTNQNIDSCIRIIKKHVEELKREAA